MANVIQFPRKDQRQCADMAEELTPYLKWIGATDQEVPIVLEKLHPRWEKLVQPFVQPFDVALSLSIPGPLRQDQLEAIDAAFRAQISAIANCSKAGNIQTLYEFAKLELQLLRAK